MRRLKFKCGYATPDEGYKAGCEYDFVDTSKAQRFIDDGIAMPVEDVGEVNRQPAQPAPRARNAIK